MEIEALRERNAQIIDAIVKKADKICPGSLALIGVYGSFMTGDVHEKSDLDLLILINDDNGWGLSALCIIGDIGYDIYCTKWDSLEEDAQFNSPNISKLMNSDIVYCAGEKYRERLLALREKVREKLNAPLSAEDADKIRGELDEAEKMLGKLIIADSDGEKALAFGLLEYHCENALCFLNKTYFKLGTKRRYEELNALKIKPEGVSLLIDRAIKSSGEKLQENAVKLVKAVRQCVEANLPASEKDAPSADLLRGTYEEMFSNWRNKMYVAAQQDNAYLSFSSLVSLQLMLADIASDCAISNINVLDGFNGSDTAADAVSFEQTLEKYLAEYAKVGLTPVRYADTEGFLADYLAGISD